MENWEEFIFSGMVEFVLLVDVVIWCIMVRGTLCKMIEVEWFLLGIFIFIEICIIVIVR